MQKLLLSLLGAGALMLPAAALAQNALVEAPIHQFVDSFNKGDIAAAAATHAPSVTIIDEVAPFSWTGSGAFTGWLQSLGKDSAAKVITDQSVEIAAPTRELVTGDKAYVIVPATYRFRQKGTAMIEKAQFTFTLEKGAADWKISGWSWTGPDATPVK